MERGGRDMTLAEIIDGLGAIANSTEMLGDGPNYTFAGGNVSAIDEAISHLEPHTQPITPEGLEARGFEPVIKPDYWSADSDTEYIRHTPNGDVVYYPESQRMCLFTRAGQTASLPGVRTLGDVDDLIRMLEGGE